MNRPDDSAHGPVTLVITRRVKAGKAQAYEAWLQALQHFERSPVREKHLREVTELVEGDAA